MSRLVRALPFLHRHESPMYGSDLETSVRGIWATKVSLAGLGLTALLQLFVVLVTGSFALLADTAHNVADALTAVPLWSAFALGTRSASRRFSYGYARVEDLAGAAVVLVIVASAVFIGYEALGRIAGRV